MKDKLIRIFIDTRSYVNRSYEDLASDILSELRCDRCKYWSGPGTKTVKGRCDLVTSNEIGDMAHVSGLGYLKTHPEFFCSLWEPKC